jgi:hypothetical protein
MILISQVNWKFEARVIAENLSAGRGKSLFHLKHPQLLI